MTSSLEKVLYRVWPLPYQSGSSSSASSSSASADTSTTNPKALSKKELNSFISCINTANKSQVLAHKVATNCLDTAKGISHTSVDGRAGSTTTTTLFWISCCINKSKVEH
jgi:hypothetical protein